MGMFDSRRQTSITSFLLGGLLGGVAGVLAAGGLRRSAEESEDADSGLGLGGFEQAPCHQEWLARRAQESQQD